MSTKTPDTGMTHELDWDDSTHRREPATEVGRVTIESAHVVLAGPEMRNGMPDVVIVIEHAVDTDGHDVAPQLASWLADQLPMLNLGVGGSKIGTAVELAS